MDLIRDPSMKPLYLFELVCLAALWGASFLFMRMAVPEFGPIALVELRTGLAALFLLPFIVGQKKLSVIKDNFISLVIVGLVNIAIPFCLLSFATLSVSAGYASILNATTPIFTALVTWFWVKEKLGIATLLGLSIGFFGVFILVFDKQGGQNQVSLLPVIAALGATFCYGVGINYTKQKLSHLSAIVIAFGSLFTASMCILPLAIWFWPVSQPSFQSWVAVSILAVACTGIAFILFFRLIANIGPNKAVTVTYLIPFFGVIWGGLLLNETLTIYMAGGGFFILLGVALSTGLFSFNKVK